MPLSSFLQKLLFINQFNIKDGRIDLLGDRYTLLNASIILSLQDIDKTKMYNSVKNSSLEHIKNLVDHAQVYKNIKNEALRNIANLSQRISKSDEGVIKTLESIFDIYGLGRLVILDMNNQDKTAILKIENSTLALSQLKIVKAKIPVCTLTAGIIAGIFSYIFNNNVDCIEKNCLAVKADSCYFEVG